MTKIVTFYNHKGGVSKTTSIFNLAHLLAEKKKKTLVVDADPQCNITEILLSPVIDTLDEKQLNTGSDLDIPGTSLLDVLKPRIEGDMSSIRIDDIVVNEINPYLHLLKGDVSLSSIEDALAEAHTQRFSTKTHEKKTYVAVADFLNRFGAAGEYDYILIDVGPSSGALTRTCFLSCDAFFIPTAPDRFNVQAIHTLAKILERWLEEHQQIYEQFLSLGLPVKRGKPQFLGTTVQQFKRSNKRPKPGFQMWMNRIPQSVEKKLFPVLKRFSTSEVDLTSGLTSSQIAATEISDFGSLAPLMQETGKAVFQFSRQDTIIITESGSPWGGSTWLDGQARMEQFKSEFEKLVTRLELITK
ncbi:AAA family ATPase [Paenibacillus sp. MZ04-78.2]|uniref:ParA family protein n=1 Tax=Paenibacillus sp. MZ04-78.2 TaxID=2962034 RepID=UPI0020B7C78B|nr:AAA family ATPase [Paenibacillus sp. MZ04-78.2]MCP3775216.1 AAA family ATPase [Paenibacillus sp. MZ04-78.2]